MTQPADLKDILSRRGVNRIVYFHTDHFEPWRALNGRSSDSYDPRNAEDIQAFGERTSALWFAKKLTLFYWPNFGRTLGDGPETLRVPGDPLALKLRTEVEDAVCRGALTGLAQSTDHEFQVHFHHEFIAPNEMYCSQYPEYAAYFADPANQKFHLPRYDLALALTLDQCRNDTGCALENWFFVHGMWALNASDLDVCTITDEIERLMRRGCLGDFTFPAGRHHCDPSTFKEPSLVKPVNAMKGYDSPAAQAEPAWGAGRRGRDKFFIWSDKVTTADASIDYYSSYYPNKAADVPGWAARILENSHVSDGTLYFKTHAHSMYRAYFENVADPYHPHEHPAFRELMDRVAEAGQAAGSRMAFLNTTEVYEEMLAGQASSAQGEPARSVAGAR